MRKLILYSSKSTLFDKQSFYNKEWIFEDFEFDKLEEDFE